MTSCTFVSFVVVKLRTLPAVETGKTACLEVFRRTEFLPSDNLQSLSCKGVADAHCHVPKSNRSNTGPKASAARWLRAVKVISEAVSKTPNESESVCRVPDEEGVVLCRANRPANASAGIARPNLPAIMAIAVVRL